MPAAVERKTEHVKILQDLGYDPWEIENDADMLSVLKAAINDLTRTNPKDCRISQLQDVVLAYQCRCLSPKGLSFQLLLMNIYGTVVERN